ncbi:MAG: SDR family oxidoreductase [Novosphingobium sp.]
MDLGLKGKKVILTGGSRGIGRAALEIFAEEGADVAFFSRNPEQVAEAVASLSRHGGKVIGEALDMSDHEAYKAWLVSAADRLGGCDIFVPGASASGSGATGDWDACLNADIKGTVIGVETLEPYLEKSGQGAIIVMASTAATETFIVPQAFNALKAALLTYSGQLSQALGPKGIRVNAVSPGPIYFSGGNWEAIKGAAPELYGATEASFALGRWGGPEEVARSIVFLASPAASYTTGTNLVIDGGYTKRVQF